MTTIRANDLNSAWTDWSLNTRDANKDGVLTRNELMTHIKGISGKRDRASLNGHPTGYFDMELNRSRKLYDDIKDNSADGVQYLNNELMSLPLALRKRASELLERDDTSMLNKIDQFVIEHARGRYASMTPMTSEMIQAKEKALDEIDDLADALGLE